MLDIRESFEIFAAKAPVNHAGSQRVADRAKRAFWHLLSNEERFWLSVERSHNLGVKCEDRGELDRVIDVVRKRLFGVAARPPRKHHRPRKGRGRKLGS